MLANVTVTLSIEADRPLAPGFRAVARCGIDGLGRRIA